MKTSIKLLEAIVANINYITNSPAAPYEKVGDKFVPCPGNYHLDGAYGGYSLCRMSKTGGGTSDVFRCGHIPKRELAIRMYAFINGIESTKS